MHTTVVIQGLLKKKGFLKKGLLIWPNLGEGVILPPPLKFNGPDLYRLQRGTAAAKQGLLVY